MVVIVVMVGVMEDGGAMMGVMAILWGKILKHMYLHTQSSLIHPRDVSSHAQLNCGLASCPISQSSSCIT